MRVWYAVTNIFGLLLSPVWVIPLILMALWEDREVVKFITGKLSMYGWGE